jgi:Staphylococcal nuclease homologue
MKSRSTKSAYDRACRGGRSGGVEGVEESLYLRLPQYVLAASTEAPAHVFWTARFLLSHWRRILAAARRVLKARRALAGVASCMLLICVAVAQQRIVARVTYITDGDTVDVKEADGQLGVIRLAGIDAPESAQPFGGESTRNLARLVAGQQIILECGRAESYGRMVCKILLRSGEDVECTNPLPPSGIGECTCTAKHW